MTLAFCGCSASLRVELGQSLIVMVKAPIKTAALAYRAYSYKSAHGSWPRSLEQLEESTGGKGGDYRLNLDSVYERLSIDTLSGDQVQFEFSMHPFVLDSIFVRRCAGTMRVLISDSIRCQVKADTLEWTGLSSGSASVTEACVIPVDMPDSVRLQSLSIGAGEVNFWRSR